IALSSPAHQPNGRRTALNQRTDLYCKHDESTASAMTQIHSAPVSISITSPTVEPIALSNPDVGPLEEQAIVKALRTGWIAPAGPDLNAFEAEVAERAGVDHAAGMASGTAARQLRLMRLSVGDG